jgi:hypothetical protein
MDDGMRWDEVAGLFFLSFFRASDTPTPITHVTNIQILIQTNAKHPEQPHKTPYQTTRCIVSTHPAIEHCL